MGIEYMARLAKRKSDATTSKQEAEKQVRKLVCNRCWHNMFRDSGFSYEVKYFQHLLFSSPGCNWCSLLKDLDLDPYHLRQPSLKRRIEYICRGTLAAELKCSDSGDGFGLEGQNEWEVSCYLETGRHSHWTAFSTSDDPAGKYVTARQVQTEVSSKLAFDQIKSWLRQCKSHQRCASQQEMPLPTRLVEVSPTGSPSRPRIVSTIGRTGVYCALSYCWGIQQEGRLLNQNHQQYSQSLDMEHLSQTLKDAIRTARQVGMQYLWVDALCIIQDSQHDKTREISQMDQIYHNALFTIVAASAADARHGFLQQRAPDPRKVYRLPFRCPDGWFGTISLQMENYIVYNKEVEPLDSRGWAFQEWLLSSRRVVYNSKTLTWRCGSKISNLGDSMVPRKSRTWETAKLPSPDSSLQEKIYNWETIVEMYSGRHLGYSFDKLPALAGIAKAIAQHRQSSYLAGIWSDNIREELMWGANIIDDLDDDNDYLADLPARPLAYRAPSWSWASVDTKVAFSSVKHDEGDFLRSCDCGITLKSSDAPFGEVTGGLLRLEARIRRGRIHSRTAISSEITWEKSAETRTYRGLMRHASQPETSKDGGVERHGWQDDRRHYFDAPEDVTDDWVEFLPLGCSYFKKGDRASGIIISSQNSGSIVVLVGFKVLYAKYSRKCPSEV